MLIKCHRNYQVIFAFLILKYFCSNFVFCCAYLHPSKHFVNFLTPTLIVKLCKLQIVNAILPFSLLCCRDLQLDKYVDLYWRDCPSLIDGLTESCIVDQCKTPATVKLCLQLRK